ncbi:MAG: glycosyltransferase family 2 protein, partial [Fibrobacteres bacterium]|nr:glycosyltransferase family 2 protein [Fibrobacterota bacterium]
DDAYLTTVTLIIPAHNEEYCIENKIRNALELDYPADKLEIIVASDCSNDNTVKIAGSIDSRIKVMDYRERGGKMRAVNRTVKIATGEIVVFTDANASYASYTIRQLIKHFADPKVGCVGGAKIIRNHPSAINSTGMGEGKYWKYESSLKTAESMSGSCVGVDGSVYAVRREIYPFPPDDIIIMDDLAVSLMLIEKGYECIFEPNARAFEESAVKVEDEFFRKSRIFAGALSLFVAMPKLMFTSIFPKLLSHKILRWLTFVFQVTFFIASFALRQEALVRPIFGLQVVFYGCVAAGFILNRMNIRIPIFHAPYYFTMTTLAQIWGIVHYLRYARQATWERRR